MKVGDRVVCVESHRWLGNVFASKGKEYIIYDVHKCTCGGTSFNIGTIRPVELRGDGSESRCACGTTYTTQAVFTTSIKFRPLQYDTCHDELINIVEEKLDIEIKQPTEAES